MSWSFYIHEKCFHLRKLFANHIFILYFRENCLETVLPVYMWCVWLFMVYIWCVCAYLCLHLFFLYVFAWWAWKNERKLLTHTYSRHSSHVSWKKTQQILTQQLIHFTLNFILSKIIISSIFLRTKAAHHSADCNVPNKNLAKMLSKENQNCYKLGRHMSYIFGHFQQWFYQIRDEQCMYLFTS